MPHQWLGQEPHRPVQPAARSVTRARRGGADRSGWLKRSLPAALADESSELSDEMRELLCEMSQCLRTLEQRIASCEARITRKFKHDERCQRLAPVRGWVR